MDRNLALEFVRVTEAAAIAAAQWIGKGDDKAADQAAVDQMRNRFNQIAFTGKVVIGEGEKDRAPMLFNGEEVGAGNGPRMDLAIDPLECTDSVAFGRYNAIAVIAAGAEGSLLAAPDVYMQKIAVGKEAAGVIDIDAPVQDNLRHIAKALGKDVGEVTVIVLDRPRHEQLIADIRGAGARVRLITDGDVAGAIAACTPGNEIDVLMGIGGSTEGVLAAVPIKIMGGQLLGRFAPKGKKQAERLATFGHDAKNVWAAADLAKGDQLTFTCTGVIEGPLLPGVVFQKDRVITHSMVLRGQSGTLRYITTHHDAFKK